MAHRAQYGVGRLAARLDLGAIGLKFDRRRLLRGKKIAQGDHVLLRERRCHRGHLRVAAAALLEVPELDVDVAPALPGEDRVVGILRIAVGPVAGDTDLGLFTRSRELRWIRLGVHSKASGQRGQTCDQTSHMLLIK